MFGMVRGFISLIISFMANMALVSAFWGFALYCIPLPLWDDVKDVLIYLHIPPTMENMMLNLSLVTILVPCLLCRTWLMQRILLWTMGARKATGKDMELVRNALSLVCEQEGTSLADYNLYVLEGADGKDCNAAAFGENNILVSRGALIELTIPQLSGILAHEAGHIYNGDTRVSVLLACMGFFGELAVNLLNISVKICGWLMWIPIANIMLALYTWAVAIVITLINYVINIPAILVTLLFSRYDEYNADRYACELGFAKELYDGLSYITKNEIPTGFYGSIWSTHPVTRKRLQRIRRYMERTI